jgi:energy-coupling factor transport system permease protein
VYARRASPLHAARASVAAVWALTLVGAALAFEHPVVLAALLLAVAGASLGAGVARDVLRVLRFALPFALLIAVINPFVYREGLTVIARLGEIPPFGQLDITLEATVYGSILGLRAIIVLLAAAVLSASVDPDEVLRLFRRISFRSALTAALAVRLVPVLQRDGRRLAEARRCRAEDTTTRRVLRCGGPSRARRAATSPRRSSARLPDGAPRAGSGRAPWSRHDVAFAASALAVALRHRGRALATRRLTAYPALAVPAAGRGEWCSARRPSSPAAFADAGGRR